VAAIAGQAAEVHCGTDRHILAHFCSVVICCQKASLTTSSIFEAGACFQLAFHSFETVNASQLSGIGGSAFCCL
jgi:hypothetical protein